MTRRTSLALLLIVLLSAALGSTMLTRGHIWGDDFAAYIMQARSILDGDLGDFMERNAFTITQSSSQIGPIAYPWGFPLMLTPVLWLVGLSPLALKLPGLLAYVAFLVAFFFLIRPRLSATESLLAVTLFAVNPTLLLFLDNILSDIPFLFASTLAVLLADLSLREGHGRRRRALAGLSGAAIFAASFVRTQGIILLGSILLLYAIRIFQNRFLSVKVKNLFQEAAILLFSFGALWLTETVAFPGGQRSYLGLYENFSLETLNGNIRSYGLLFGDFFAGLPGQGLIFAIFATLFALGLAARFKEDLLFVIYSGFYLLVLWSWPEWQGVRFIFPLLPFFIYFAFQGLAHGLKQIKGREGRAASKFVYTIIGILAIGLSYQSARLATSNMKEGRAINGPFDPYSIQLYEFIKEETPPDAIIVFFKPRAMRMMTGHDALSSTECERMQLGDYVALSKKVGENLQIPPERIGECWLPLERVYQNRRFIVYRLGR